MARKERRFPWPRRGEGIADFFSEYVGTILVRFRVGITLRFTGHRRIQAWLTINHLGLSTPVRASAHA